MPAEQVPVLQKKMIQKCRDVGKPVIVATQMLESMRENAAPTRAEISDVANAVFDGADAVMLSAETSSGKHPVEAVKYMARACRAAEQVCSPEILTARTNSNIETDAIARSVIQLTQELPVQKIVVGSISGKTVASIARHRPKINILALVRSKMLMRQLNLFRNVTPLYVKEDLPSDRDWLVSALTRVGVDNRHLRPEDLVVLVSGSGISGKSENSIIEVAKVFDVCDI
jgi:pyruvate kinase